MNRKGTERITFHVNTFCGLANALRRTIIEDLPSWAPFEVTITTNTSCQTDEFIAHRIGMIPFHKTNESSAVNEATLTKIGPGMVYARDIVSIAFTPVFPDLPVIELADEQTIDLVFYFDFKTGSHHARYAMAAATGMKKTGNESYQISFSLNNDKLHTDHVLHDCLTVFERRVDDALMQLANQPNIPPSTKC